MQTFSKNLWCIFTFLKFNIKSGVDLKSWGSQICVADEGTKPIFTSCNLNCLGSQENLS